MYVCVCVHKCVCVCYMCGFVYYNHYPRRTYNLIGEKTHIIEAETNCVLLHSSDLKGLRKRGLWAVHFEKSFPKAHEVGEEGRRTVHVLK